MAWTFGAVSLFVVLAWSVGFVRFWRDTGELLGDFFQPVPFGRAVWDALTLKNLDGNGDGCTYPDETFSQVRRRYHHLTFYGFMLCFAATSVATLYHYVFGWEAPYALFSLPVLLGVAGGAGLLIGPAGLMRLKSRRDPALADPKQTGMDASFLVLLFLISLTGLMLLGLAREAGGHVGAPLARAPGRGDGIIPLPALRQVCPRHLSPGGAGTLSPGAAPAGAGIRRGLINPGTRHQLQRSKAMDLPTHQIMMTVLMTPDMANFTGNVHGGTILKLLDQVAYSCASRYAGRYVVTLSVDQVTFRQPIHVGELVTFRAAVNHTGNSSMEIGVKVLAENIRTQVVRHANSCYFTMVALDDAAQADRGAATETVEPYRGAALRSGGGAKQMLAAPVRSSASRPPGARIPKLP